MAGEFLRVVRGPTEGAEMRVEEAGEVILGRDVDGLGYLGESPELSRRHARLARAADGGLLLEDLGSLNGTHVNGDRLTGAHRLAPGDTVRIGDVLLAVVDATGRGGQPTAYARDTPAPTVANAASRGRSGLLDPQFVILAVVMVAIATIVFIVLT